MSAGLKWVLLFINEFLCTASLVQPGEPALSANSTVHKAWQPVTTADGMCDISFPSFIISFPHSNHTWASALSMENCLMTPIKQATCHHQWERMGRLKVSQWAKSLPACHVYAQVSPTERLPRVPPLWDSGPLVMLFQSIPDFSFWHPGQIKEDAWQDPLPGRCLPPPLVAKLQELGFSVLSSLLSIKPSSTWRPSKD